MTAQRYQIVVKGLPQAEWAARLEEAEILPVGNDQFLLSEVLLDQPALHGLLDRIRAVGLELISVKFASADRNLAGNPQEAKGENDRCFPSE
jgi:hypothetical protein